MLTRSPAILLSLILVFVIVLAPQALAKEKGKDAYPRLSESIKPSSYKIFIEPDLENKQFSGEETIFLTVLKATDDIVLHSRDLDIAEPELASLDKGHGAWLSPETVIEKEKEQVRFRFEKKLKPGDYELRLKFGGALTDKLVGFYYSRFKDESGAERFLCATQLEPTDARRVFPCFDEPCFKAVFKLTASVDPDMVAISNAPVRFIKEDQRRNKKLYSFADTPVMSTYLLALVVGPFEAAPVRTAGGVEIRTWTTTGKTAQGLYGQDVAVKLLPFFENFFGVKYPLKKLDLIAVPDFGPGAMENLGAVTFRETRLLVDEKTASTSSRQHVAGVIAHEMAHMWFGDLVTMKWWDDLWLNEAFASFMSVKAVDFLKPEWRVWDSFTSERATALSSDALASTRSIYAPVKSPHDAEAMFDEITYEKGASVLLMLEQYLGEDVFARGIADYIDRHKFGNAATAALWESLEKVSGKPVSKIMDRWIFAAGYPLVTATEKKSGLLLEQERFYLAGSEGGDDTTIWQIPVRVRRLDDQKNIGTILLADKLADKLGSGEGIASGDAPLVVNASSSGYFRVKYPLPHLKRLADAAVSSLTVAERYQLLSDTWALAESGEIPIAFYLDMTGAYKEDRDPNVIGLLISQLQHLDWFVKPSSPERERFAAFVRDRLGPLKEKLGWDAAQGETDLDELLRSKVLTAMGTLGQDRDTIEEARKRFEAYERDETSVNPNLYDAIVGIVAYNGGSDEYDRLLVCFKNAGTAESKVRNLLSLADFRDDELLSRTLAMSLSEDVRTQDAPHLVRNVLSTSAGRHVGWAFVKKHWQEMEQKYPVHLFPRVIKGARSLISVGDMKDLEAFLNGHPIRSGDLVAARVIERVRLNVAVDERSGAELHKWLASFGSSM